MPTTYATAEPETATPDLTPLPVCVEDNPICPLTGTGSCPTDPDAALKCSAC